MKMSRKGEEGAVMVMIKGRWGGRLERELTFLIRIKIHFNLK